MPGYAIGKSMNYGFPGTFARTPDDVIMSRPVASDSADIAFGAPVILNAGNTYTAGGSALTADNFAGVAVRIVQQATAYAAQDEGAYKANQAASVLERGNVMVTCNVGTPTAGGDVYIRTAANASIAAGVVGGFEAAADGDNTVKLTNAKWATGLMDGNNVAELCLLTRNNP
jgi:hypothetical protein